MSSFVDWYFALLDLQSKWFQVFLPREVPLYTEFTHHDLYLQQVPENRIILLTTLFVEMFYCIVQNINLALGPNGVAIVTIVIFEHVALITGFLFSLCLLLWKLRGRHRWKYSVPLVVQFVGTLLYLYGDNIPQLMNRYGSELGCGAACQENNNITGIFFLGIALLIFKLGPTVWENIYNYAFRTEIASGAEPKSEESKFLLWPIEMITYMVKIDAVYSALLAMEQSSDPCSGFHLRVSTSLLVICTATWILASITYTFSAYELTEEKVEHQGEGCKDNKCTYTVCTSFLASFALVLYMLADNDLPLSCAFQCDTPVNATGNCNTTTTDVSCRDPLDSWVRFCFTAIALICIILAILYISVQYKHQWPKERETFFANEPVVTFEDLTLNPAVRLTGDQKVDYGLAFIDGGLRIVTKEKAKLGTEAKVGNNLNYALGFSRHGNKLRLVPNKEAVNATQYGLNESYEVVQIAKATKVIIENWAVGKKVTRIGIVPTKSILTKTPFFP